jgi:hypothetical protein
MRGTNVRVVLCVAVFGSAAVYTGVAFAAGLLTASAPRSTHLTVYNDNFALVREERSMELQQGRNAVRVTGVAAQIDPTSVSLQPVSKTASMVVREQSYRYDFITPNALLNRAVGKAARITPPGGGAKIEGILLNPAEAIRPLSLLPPGYAQMYGQRGYVENLGGLVVKTEQGYSVYRGTGYQSEGTVVELGEEALPEGLVSEPELLWQVEATQGGRQDCVVSYLTDLIGWKADYAAVVDEVERQVDLTGWVTISNNSGATYRDASLQLMAGDVRRLRPEERGATDRWGGRGGGAGGFRAPPPQFQEQPFFEYHLYTLEGKTTVSNKETKQLSFLSAQSVPVSKGYVYEGGRPEWQRWLTEEYYQYPDMRGMPEGPSAAGIKTVGVVLEFENAKERHLGIPLPMGAVRVYKSDRAGRLQYIGEDQIGHTPAGEKVRLLVGNAFDVVGERIRSEFKIIVPGIEYEETFEITLRNHKAEPIEVTVVEHPFASWEVLETSQPYKQKDAHTIEYNAPVSAHGEAKVTYRVRVVH